MKIQKRYCGYEYIFDAISDKEVIYNFPKTCFGCRELDRFNMRDRQYDISSSKSMTYYILYNFVTNETFVVFECRNNCMFIIEEI